MRRSWPSNRHCPYLYHHRVFLGNKTSHSVGEANKRELLSLSTISSPAPSSLSAALSRSSSTSEINCSHRITITVHHSSGPPTRPLEPDHKYRIIASSPDECPWQWQQSVEGTVFEDTVISNHHEGALEKRLIVSGPFHLFAPFLSREQFATRNLFYTFPRPFDATEPLACHLGPQNKNYASHSNVGREYSLDRITEAKLLHVALGKLCGISHKWNFLPGRPSLVICISPCRMSRRICGGRRENTNTRLSLHSGHSSVFKTPTLLQQPEPVSQSVSQSAQLLPLPGEMGI